MRWINDLKDPTGNFLPHLLPVDQTLHWANPPAVDCRDGFNQTDCATNNPAPYLGPVPMITHLHGAHVDPHSDGYPEAWYLPAATNIPVGYARKGRLFDDRTGTNTGNLGFVDFSYRNDQPATTLWFHDHSVGMTRVNVYAGPAGFWLIRGGVYDGANKSTGGAAVLPGPAPIAGEGVVALNTPGDALRNKIREIPIAIQDRSFNVDGSLFYPAQRTFFDNFAGPYVPATDIPPFWNPEAFFNTIVVNGTTWPELRVARALVPLPVSERLQFQVSKPGPENGRGGELQPAPNCHFTKSAPNRVSCPRWYKSRPDSPPNFPGMERSRRRLRPSMPIKRYYWRWRNGPM